MRYVKRILRLLLVLALVVLAFAAGALAVLTLTERGRENLAGLISDFASSPGQTVTDQRPQRHLVGQADTRQCGGRGCRRALAGRPRHRRSTGRRCRCFPRPSRPTAIFAERVELARLPKGESAPTERGRQRRCRSRCSSATSTFPTSRSGRSLPAGSPPISAKGSVRRGSVARADQDQAQARAHRWAGRQRRCVDPFRCRAEDCST